MVENHYDKEKNCIFVKARGTVNIKDMKNAIDFLMNNPDLKGNLKIMEDAMDVKVEFTKDEIDSIVCNMEDVASKFNSVKHAVVHNIALNTAFAYIAENKIKESKYECKVFATLKAGKQWLGI